MNKYEFGKGLLATVQNKNSVQVSKLVSPLKVGESALDKDTVESICLSFTSIKSVDKMIADLQCIRKNMLKKKIKKILEEIK